MRWQHPTRGLVGPASSSRWPRRPGSSCRSGAGCSSTPSPRSPAGASASPTSRCGSPSTSPPGSSRARFLHEVRAGARGRRPAARSPRPGDHRVDLIKESGSPRSTLEALREIGVRSSSTTSAPATRRSRTSSASPSTSSRSTARSSPASAPRRGHGDRRRHRRDGPLAGPAGRRRGRRGRGPARAPARAGCHAAQGYLFSGPLHGDAFAAFLADEEPHPEAAVAAL